MKRTLAAVGTPAIAALVLLGGAPNASAGEQHSHHSTRSATAPHGPAVAERGKHHHATCGGKCTPAPKPPAGGWPCQQTHSCKPPKVPHCPPVKHPHKPPVKPPTTVTPKPPVRTPATPIVHRSTPQARPAAPTDVPQLAMTGGVPWPEVIEAFETWHYPDPCLHHIQAVAA
jgi:hypothetical protein